MIKVWLPTARALHEQKWHRKRPAGAQWLTKALPPQGLKVEKKGKQIGTTIHVQSTWRRVKTDIPCGRGKERYWQNPQGGVRFQGF